MLLSDCLSEFVIYYFLLTAHTLKQHKGHVLLCGMPGIPNSTQLTTITQKTAFKQGLTAGVLVYAGIDWSQHHTQPHRPLSLKGRKL